jgi:hypothetical protein
MMRLSAIMKMTKTKHGSRPPNSFLPRHTRHTERERQPPSGRRAGRAVQRRGRRRALDEAGVALLGALVDRALRLCVQVFVRLRLALRAVLLLLSRRAPPSPSRVRAPRAREAGRTGASSSVSSMRSSPSSSAIRRSSAPSLSGRTANRLAARPATSPLPRPRPARVTRLPAPAAARQRRACVRARVRGGSGEPQRAGDGEFLVGVHESLPPGRALVARRRLKQEEKRGPVLGRPARDRHVALPRREALARLPAHAAAGARDGVAAAPRDVEPERLVLEQLVGREAQLEPKAAHRRVQLVRGEGRGVST